MSPIRANIYGFATHRFRRVRDYGYLHSNAKTRLVLLQVLLHVQLPPPAIKIAVQYHCAQCHGGMRIVGFLKPG